MNFKKFNNKLINLDLATQIDVDGIGFKTAKPTVKIHFINGTVQSYNVENKDIDVNVLANLLNEKEVKSVEYDSKVAELEQRIVELEKKVKELDKKGNNGNHKGWNNGK